MGTDGCGSFLFEESKNSNQLSYPPFKAIDANATIVHRRDHKWTFYLLVCNPHHLQQVQHLLNQECLLRGLLCPVKIAN